MELAVAAEDVRDRDVGVVDVEHAGLLESRSLA
jgi:hypothetical protein